MPPRRGIAADISTIIHEQEAKWADDAISEGSMDSLDRKILGLPSDSSPAPRRTLSRPRTNINIPSFGEPGWMTAKDRIAALVAKRDALYAGMVEHQRRYQAPSSVAEEEHISVSVAVPRGEEVRPEISYRPYTAPKRQSPVAKEELRALSRILHERKRSDTEELEEMYKRTSQSSGPLPQGTQTTSIKQERQPMVRVDDSDRESRFSKIERSMREGLAAIRNDNHRVEEIIERSPSPVKRARYSIGAPPVLPKPECAEDRENKLETIEDIQASLARRRALMDGRANRSTSPSPSPVKQRRNVSASRFGKVERAEEAVEKAVDAKDAKDVMKAALEPYKERSRIQGSVTNTYKERAQPDEMRGLLEQKIEAEEASKPYTDPITAQPSAVDNRHHMSAAEEVKILLEEATQARNVEKEINAAAEEEASGARAEEAVARQGKHIRKALMRASGAAPLRKKPIARGTPRRKSAARILSFKNEDGDKHTGIKAEEDVEDTIMDRTLENFATSSARQTSSSIPSIPPIKTPSSSRKSPNSSKSSTLTLPLPHFLSFLRLYTGSPSRPTPLGITLLTLLLWYILETLTHAIIGKPSLASPSQSFDITGPVWGDALPTLLDRIFGWPVGELARVPRRVVMEWPGVVRRGVEGVGWSGLQREAVRRGVSIEALYRSELKIGEVGGWEGWGEDEVL